MVATYLVGRQYGFDSGEIKEAVANFKGVPGRSEFIEAGQDFHVVVDFAHTPQAVSQVVALGRRLARPGAKVWIVVGATGERDRYKRPGMGAAAAKADVAVLSTDSPGHEDPMAIIEQMRLGTLGQTSASVVIEPDRATAIRLAVSEAASGDVVLLVGRGHETSQRMGDDRNRIDDREVAKESLRSRGYSETIVRRGAGVSSQ
jgi:UDP-N-acetylmuramoyl-L-alanyl-D-glutamate--2,6-diaminopimelate ligase